MIELIKIPKDQLKGKKPILEPVPNVFICGGAIRQWFLGTEASSDIDVFGTTPEVLEDFIYTSLKNCKLLSENPFTKTFDYKGQFVQVMYGLPFHNILDAFESFDFTICQFAWFNDEIYSTANAICSALRGHLGVHEINQNFAVDSLRRAFKYQSKGYIPCSGTIRDLGLGFVNLTDEQIKKQLEISPNGGLRTVRID